MAGISDIRRELSEMSSSEWPVFIERYVTDQRAGVQKLVDKCLKQMEKAAGEDAR